MKTFLKITLAILLISIPGLAGYATSITRKPTELAQTNNTISAELPVALPVSAIVYPKKGSSLSGKLTQFNAKNLTIAVGDISKPLSITEVKQVEFSGDIWVVDADGSPRKLRGPDSISNRQQTWQAVPISAFQLKTPQEAKLRLDGVVNREERADILSVAKDSVYVLQAIVFESSEKMTIRATPVDK